MVVTDFFVQPIQARPPRRTPSAQAKYEAQLLEIGEMVLDLKQNASIQVDHRGYQLFNEVTGHYRRFDSMDELLSFYRGE